MHGLCLVVGDKPDRTLEKYADRAKADPYKQYLSEEDVRDMQEHYQVKSGDLECLVPKMQDWNQAEGGLENGRLFFWATENPNGKFDWYRIGGRFAGYLKLREPRPARGLKRLLGHAPTTQADQARKHEIDEEAIKSSPPTAIVLEGEWLECPLSSEPSVIEERKEAFQKAFDRVPAESLLTVVDFHS